MELGEWTHLMGTYASDTREQILYVNGVEFGRRTANYATNRQYPLRIGGGATEGHGSFFFEGAIDEVAVYDYAFSAEQVAAHFKQGKPIFSPVEERPLLVADFTNPGPMPLGNDAARLEVTRHRNATRRGGPDRRSH